MAHHSATKKSIRQTVRRTAINRNRIASIRTYIKKVEAAIASKDKKGAQEALRVAQPHIMRGVAKKVLKKNTASRKISRLSAHIKALAS